MVFIKRIWNFSIRWVKVNEAFRLPSGAGNPNKRTNPRDEPKLHRIQIPPDQSSSMD